MNIQAAGAILIVSALLTVAPLSTRCLAQANDTNASVTPNTQRASPHHHRYWRFRGGVHPHYGSRRVRT